ncbi:MAG TPA: sigma-70 family RNA polymerase sigma factor [Terriglobales bacterium]|nr:sigma-70 family RNA polymerase sigma factor [Terriglobales bacterium]
MASSSKVLYLPGVAAIASADRERIYEANRHRVYSLAFWMTNNELAAETVAQNTFVRAFAAASEPTAEMIDRALLAEVRELMPVGELTLACAPATAVVNVRRNVKRVHLECAVVELPATERLLFLLHDVEGYDQTKISRLLGVSADEVLQGLHQARLRMRELIAEQN